MRHVTFTTTGKVTYMYTITMKYLLMYDHMIRINTHIYTQSIQYADLIHNIQTLTLHGVWV